MKAVTTKQYDQLRGLKSKGGAARKAIKLGHNLPGMVKIEKFGKSHQIWVTNEFYEANKKRLKKVA